ncbi:hypothetical protein QOZ80_2BG0155750 [Eleusine coracana subsp. coracana]|nr:hypothetical protein QOZ80_2BG0155750 [Eleusine coracana subsp. coracana]
MARFMMEVAPSKAVSGMMRRRKTMLMRRLDPIAEEEMEHHHQLASYGHDRHHHQTAAWQQQERTGELIMRELGKYFSGAQEQGGSCWEQRSPRAGAGHHRRAVYA